MTEGRGSELPSIVIIVVVLDYDPAPALIAARGDRVTRAQIHDLNDTRMIVVIEVVDVNVEILEPQVAIGVIVTIAARWQRPDDEAQAVGRAVKAVVAVEVMA